jgi:hypothetical protein
VQQGLAAKQINPAAAHVAVGLAPVQASQQAIHDDIAGATGEYPLETGPQRRCPSGTGIALPGLQVGIQLPNRGPRQFDCPTLLVVCRHQLVHQPLGVDPAECVLAEAKLAGIIGDDDRVRQQPARLDRAPERPLGGDPYRVGRGCKNLCKAPWLARFLAD